MTNSIQAIPFLTFNGNCADAMQFYEKVLGGTITVMLTAGDSPMADQTPPEYKNMVLNCQLQLPGGSWLYAGDCPPHLKFQGYQGFSLALNCTSVEEGEVIFNQLADGGRVSMPYAPTFWAEKFGMVTDKFGMDWLINGVLTKL